MKKYNYITVLVFFLFFVFATLVHSLGKTYEYDSRLVLVADTTYYQYTAVCDSQAIVEYEQLGERVRIKLVEYYRNGELLCAEYVGYCDSIGGKRFEARCPERGLYYADTTINIETGGI